MDKLDLQKSSITGFYCKAYSIFSEYVAYVALAEVQQDRLYL